ncbi:MAG TPA: 4-hydroxythreonine-4-phosphate dehydrogenase PdxA [Oscillatoriales cyanobacterium M59_W2019_021]|nr:4-hydroxythreonine-4-phosphate dehydrogenase PdxA [Oscillatoriales cyanobacterium M4454_W2019_049]HIK51618.1 4-hydroxythreonine-4-phosphate dehydrogenase PdxA [Oscillatoriales cyanobacterium M59_W2019_021]
MTRIAITLGDPAGIGPEVVLKALGDRAIASICPMTIVGSRSVLVQTYRQLRDRGQGVANPDDLEILEVETGDSCFTPGIGNSQSGASSFAYLETAIARTLAGEFQGIVTGPIAKSLWKLAGHEYPGQTELLAEKAGVEKFGMLFVARSPHTGWTLRTLLATTHIPLVKVSTTLTPELMTRKLNLLLDCLQKNFGIDRPKIAIAGLNPHSGEEGQLGTEEKEWLTDWLIAQRDRLPHVQIDGLIPPDTMWVKPGQAWFGGNASAHDGYLALYHDQGLIPVKLMAFDRAVNTTIGLPFIRTSPDHGTAFDIAGKGIADASSMKAAISLAAELTKIRAKT